MKIELHEGCITAGLYINGRSEWDYSEEERQDIIENIMNNIRQSIIDDERSIRDILELVEPDEMIDEGDCEQCGDTLYTTFWILDEEEE